MDHQRVIKRLGLPMLAYLLLSAQTTSPTPITYPAPSVATVTQLCTRDQKVLDQWSFVSPYLLCYNYDARTEGVLFFKESGPETKGSFKLIPDPLGRSALSAVDLTNWVPSNTANALVSGLHSSNQAPTVYPTPRVATVTQLCTNSDSVLDRWSFVSPYLLCYSYNKHTESVKLFKGVGPGPDGSFRLIHDTLGESLFSAGYLTYRLGLPSNTADALVSGLHSSNQTPPIAYQTPSLATVTQLCIGRGNDLALGAWNFVSPYLLCYNYDKYTGGVGLYKASGPGPKGSFRFIFGGGGAIDVPLLVETGVPSATANALVSGLHTGNATPPPSLPSYPTPSLSTVKAMCVMSGMVLGTWSFASPYLLCYSHGARNTSGMLFKETGSNASFRPIGGVNEHTTTSDLVVDFGVPNNTADALLSELHS
ncbi:MAG: hypothetical protein JOZ91_02200 [Candidatus Eremiobacteraeota bacterium]|nr:hypothetical protein [Candidatus Eremiobacteraeota bacterium]MBV8204789.1 hypothetical protein [Candidatus Eremiobacteraeota bacterium]MBV8340122.1 hypothetical protein [Candidatus Eremiobacteraeota bacterium]MBV8670444.1 hypothetical protein [Candidatus Eremiobacteraeota bacterium]